ncbi:MAG: transporter [Myxococcaceae bacterium]|nr:transporter [Myxococcaceae bacterium]
MKKTHRTLTLVAILLSLFMGAMEATVIATAMPTVVADLGGLELYGWVSSVYLLASTVTIPLYGKLSDLYGRKPLMLLGIALFLAGSMASGLAQTMPALIAFRALQATGAGALQALAFTIVGDIYTAQERAKIQGVFGAVWGFAGVSGPFLGGVIVHLLSWRWVFFVNVPVGILAAGVLTASFHEERREKKKPRLDLEGAALLSTTIIALLLGVSRVAPMITLPIAALSLVAFIWVERRAADAVLPLDLFSTPLIAVASGLGACLGGSMMATVTYLPLYLQAVLQATPTEAGATLAPMLVGWPVASALSGRLLARFAYRTLIITGWVITCVSTIALAILVTRAAPINVFRVGMLTLGVGLGLVSTPLLISVQESVTWAQRGVATASTTFFRTIGGSIMVGALGAVLAAHLRGGADPRAVNSLFGPEHGRNLAPAVLRDLAGMLSSGLETVFVVIAVVVVFALVVSFFYPRIRMATGAPPPAASKPAPSLPLDQNRPETATPP